MDDPTHRTGSRFGRGMLSMQASRSVVRGVRSTWRSNWLVDFDVRKMPVLGLLVVFGAIMRLNKRSPESIPFKIE